MESNFDGAILFNYILNLVIVCLVTYNLWGSFATNIKKTQLSPDIRIQIFSNQTYLYVVYTGNKYKNMIVDLDEKIRNLNWIFRLRVSTHTHCSKKWQNCAITKCVSGYYLKGKKQYFSFKNSLKEFPKALFPINCTFFSDFNPLLWKIFKCDYGNLDGDGDDDAYRCQH